MMAGFSWSVLHKGYVDGDGRLVDIQQLQPLQVDGVGTVYACWEALRALSALLVDRDDVKAELALRSDDIDESELDGIG